MTEEIKKTLAAGRPFRGVIQTVDGPGVLTLVPFHTDPKGILIVVENEGTFFLRPGCLPTIYDLVAAGIFWPTAENLYQFLADLLRRRPRRRMGDAETTALKRPNQEPKNKEANG